MRKLAPMFVMTSLVALVGGNAVAAMNDKTTTTTGTTMTSPTVSPNTNNPQNLSYSDKSNTSPGTNAVMDDKSKPMAAADTTDDDKNLQRTKKKMKKAKIAAHTDATVKSDAAMTSGSVTSSNSPTRTTDGAAANSTTGRSAGQ